MIAEKKNKRHSQLNNCADEIRRHESQYFMSRARHFATRRKQGPLTMLLHRDLIFCTVCVRKKSRDALTSTQSRINCNLLSVEVEISEWYFQTIIVNVLLHVQLKAQFRCSFPPFTLRWRSNTLHLGFRSCSTHQNKLFIVFLFLFFLTKIVVSTGTRYTK